MTILLVEDEDRLAAALIELFHSEKYLADHADNGEDGLYAALQKDYDVIVLDVMLPKMDGFAVVHALRRAGKKTPVLMLTARDEIRDKIEGLDQGADDYMTKPFVPEELLARVRALSRRQGEVLLDELRFGDLCLSLATNELSTPGQSVRLAFKEAELLKLLIANKGVILSKETILRKLWGDESDAVENNVEAYVSFLRKKLSFLRSSVKIQAIRRQGYLLLEEETR
ncbi:response regulator transcription factor [Stomatobaculum sp. F0698]|jgi:DNA-binding response regulator dltR|uniref:response regulator transcription factor n=1 Tax=Stomatobaculum sp. F0698 TaxID=3059030 RepID=UPI00272C3EB2|nr:response regulator transcription factor [Stomatobaculum sp. F0698]WLD86947.1 response regulator transcription factor [Stomatobaculum sp. F0698]